MKYLNLKTMFILVILSLLILPQSGFAEERKLVMVGWGGAWEETMKKAFGDPFEKETGIKVVYTSPIDFGKMKAMVESGNVEWDVSQAGFSGFRRRLRQASLAALLL